MALRSSDAYGIQIRKDTFRDEIMLARGNEWRPFKDADYVRIREGLEKRSFKPISHEMVRQAVLEVADKSEFDSAIAWLGALQWDGVPRVEGFAVNYLQCEDSDYAKALSRYWWTALAGRVLEPGCQADMVPVLVGPQGCGKTTGTKALVEDPDHFASIALDERDADLSRRMRGKLVGEIAELKGLQTRAAGAIKDFITKTHEHWTPKYQEFACKFPRRIVFIGTTNEDEFLSDDTGNRRWLPIKVGKIEIAGITRDRVQLWAEGAVLFAASGVDFRAAELLAAKEHDDYFIPDTWQQPVNTWLAGNDDLTGSGPARRDSLFTAHDVFVGALQMDAKQVNKTSEQKLASVLRRLGYKRVRSYIDGVQVRAWSK
jgi:predicted P-loop ATPase